MPNTPSANNTVVTMNGGTVTDASNNVWVLSNGQVQVNGVVDPTTANVIKLAYVNGQVWQENADNDWWAKSSPDDAWSPTYGTPASPVPVSANDTVAHQPGSYPNSFNYVQTIVDAGGNVWSIDPGQVDGGQVVVNGAVDPTTANVTRLAYVNGQIWQQNVSGQWWAKSNPSDAWSPDYGTPTSPLPPGVNPVSANNTVIGQPYVYADITDANHNVWSINAGNQVTVNGAVDPTTANVTTLAYENGQIWQENASGLWWAKSSPSDTWSPAYGTPTSPIPTRTWIGGGDNAASNPSDWSPTGTPQPGDTLQVSSPATINVAGNELAGDPMNIAANVTINTSDNAPLNFVASPGSTVNLNVTDTVLLNADSQGVQLNASGGTIQFIGLTYFLDSSALLSANLTGNARILETSDPGKSSTVELNGSVGQGLRFEIAGHSNLQIDRPDQFAGAIDINRGSTSAVVTFEGLTATSGELLNGILSLFNGDQQVGSFRVTNDFRDAPPTLDQTSTGVVLSEHHNFPGSATATPILVTFGS